MGIANGGVNENSTLNECVSKEGAVLKLPTDSNASGLLLMQTSGNELLKNINSSNGSLEIGSSADGLLVPKTAGNSDCEPKVGMVFDSEDRAYNFYNSYAKQKGFSVRKDHLSRRIDGRIRYRHYVCSNEGTRKDPTYKTKKSRPIERTNCLSRIEFKVNNENLWVVNRFIDEHNHPLAPPNSSHMLRSHRKKLPIQRAEISRFTASIGVKDAQINDFHQEGIQDAGLHWKSEINYLSTKRMRELQNGDAQFLLNFLRAKQADDPSFFYAIQLDENERFTNCFWADMQSIMDYAYFGDSVLFDTTYRPNTFSVPFAPFIGVNHHKQVTLFGAAILLDDTVESFMWLFRTFLTAMSGKQPKTFFTDNSSAISEAISVVLPNSRHRICFRHLLQQASIHFSYLDFNLQTEFENCIYNSNSETSFNQHWNVMISKYNLSSSQWFKDLYSLRDKWCTVYFDGTFAANMLTKQWSENMNNLFKIHFQRQLPLTRFIVQCLKSLIELREKEIIEDFESTQTKPVLFADVPMLFEAAESYTRTVYTEFEQEYRGQLACLCQLTNMEGTKCTFNVTSTQKQSHGIVEFNPSDTNVVCSCKKFETYGILCMHALKVLNYNNILRLPTKYIMKRWSKHAKDGGIQASLRTRYSQVCQKAIALSLKSAVSKDALDILEQAFDKLISLMENAMHNTQSVK